MLVNGTMADLDDSYNNTSLDKSISCYRTTDIHIHASSPCCKRTDIDVLAGTVHSNNMDNISTVLEPVSPMARLHKEPFHPWLSLVLPVRPVLLLKNYNIKKKKRSISINSKKLTTSMQLLWNQP
jgi:hypothetical protein